MSSNESLAVGLAVGIPCFVVLSVSVFFWYRSCRKYKKEMEREREQDLKDVNLDDVSFQYENVIPTKDGSAAATNPSSPTDEIFEVSQQVDTPSASSTSLKQVGRSDKADSNISLPNRARPGSRMPDYYDSVIPILPPPSKTVGTPTDAVNGALPPKTRSTSSFLTHTPSFLLHKNESSASNIFDRTEYIKQLHKNDSSSFPTTTQTVVNASPDAINSMNNFYKNSSTSQILDTDVLIERRKETPGSDLAQERNQSPFENTFDTPPRRSQYIQDQHGDEFEGYSSATPEDELEYTNYRANKAELLNSLKPNE